MNMTLKDKRNLDAFENYAEVFPSLCNVFAS